MGNQTSKKSQETSAKSVHYTTELRSYAAACKADTELQSFDTCLQARTSHVISTLATGVEVRALSFDSLKEVTQCLLEMNQEVVKVILDCKKDIWKNQEMFELVEDYFENSLKTLDFCAALEKGLRRARDSHLLILVALQQFEDESLVQGMTFISFLFFMVLIRDGSYTQQNKFIGMGEIKFHLVLFYENAFFS